MGKLLVLFLLGSLIALSLCEGERENKKGKAMKVSGLDLKANNTLGSGMFEMSKEGDEENSIKFGIAKIRELTSADKEIGTDKHGCRFDDEDVVECTESAEEAGTMSGLDSEGAAAELSYALIKRECALSCNTNANAKLTIYSYIFKEKGYICQPDCEADDFEQSTVFDGTAKWAIEVSDWDFCSACDDDGTTVDGAKLKIFFSLDGKSKGKSKGFGKRAPKTFDVSKCEERVAKEITEKGDKDTDTDKGNKDKGDKDTGNKDKDTEREKSDGRRRRETDNENNANKIKAIKVRCKASRDTSFDGEPEDQDSFEFSEEGDQEKGPMSFRMFPSALLDKDLGSEKAVSVDDESFVGPAVETVTEDVGSSGKTRDVKYVTICVPKFTKSLWYDPAGDMSETGGTTDSSSMTSSASVVILLSAVIAAFFC